MSRSGKDSIDHSPHGHDDLANAVAGVADATRLPYYDPFMGCGSEDDRHPPTPGWKLAGFGSKEEAEAYKARRRAQHGRSVSFPWDGYSRYSMSTFRPLHFSDTQLASVRRAAALLRPAERSQFLQAIAYELADIDPIDDEAVKGRRGDYGCRCTDDDGDTGVVPRHQVKAVPLDCSSGELRRALYIQRCMLLWGKSANQGVF